MDASKAHGIPRFLANVYLIYLGLLPTLATVIILAKYGLAAPFLVFLGGVVAVSVYLAAVYSYTPLPNSVGWLLILLLDGPLWVVISLLQGGDPLAAALEAYLIDGTAVWVSILWLALRSPLPTRPQRVASVAFMLIAIITTFFLFGPYFRDELWGNWLKLITLSLGAMQATSLYFYRLKKEDVLRDSDNSILYIVGLLFAWIATLPIGNGLYLGWK